MLYTTFNVWDMLRRTGMTILAVAELLATWPQQNEYICILVNNII